MPAGIQQAVNLFKKTYKEVPAYKTFIKKHKVSAESIRTGEDFKKVPIMEKKNYLYANDFKDLFSNNEIPPMIYASSGSSGQPTFWFRGNEQEVAGGKIHEKIFSEIFGIKKSESTLVVICFSMGVWVAGNYTLAACRYISNRGYKLTTVTPGIEKSDILNCIKTLAPNFKNLILAGYPPFVMDVVQEALKKRIKFNKNTKVITAGDKFSEEWRNVLAQALNVSPLNSIISIYGCADAAVLGYETPLSIFIRRESLKRPQLYQELFGDEEIQPALVQYDPEHVYFEEHNNELIFTADTAIPLIRYNIHDLGQIFSYRSMLEKLADLSLSKSAQRLENNNFKFPFIVKKGRTDVAVTFYAINIYPEQIKAAVGTSKLKKFLTGNFFARNNFTNNHKTEKLLINFELGNKVKSTPSLKEQVRLSIVNTLREMSLEYRKLFTSIGSKALPEVVLVKQGGLPINNSGLLNLEGKKPKVVINA